MSGDEGGMTGEEIGFIMLVHASICLSGKSVCQTRPVITGTVATGGSNGNIQCPWNRFPLAALTELDWTYYICMWSESDNIGVCV